MAEPTRYDLIAIGSGSAANLIDPFLRRHPNARVAIIDKDKPGGICLTRGCIPTKLLTVAADVVRTVQRSQAFGVDAPIRRVAGSYRGLPAGSGPSCGRRMSCRSAKRSSILEMRGPGFEPGKH